MVEALRKPNAQGSWAEGTPHHIYLQNTAVNARGILPQSTCKSPDFSFILEQALITEYRNFNHLDHHVQYLYGFFSIGQLYVSLPIHPSSQTQGPTMDRMKECIESRIVIRLVNGVTPDLGTGRGFVSLHLGWLSLLDLSWLDNLNLYTLSPDCHSSIFSNKSLVSDMIHCTSTSGSITSKATATCLRLLSHPSALPPTAVFTISEGQLLFGL